MVVAVSKLEVGLGSELRRTVRELKRLVNSDKPGGAGLPLRNASW